MVKQLFLSNYKQSKFLILYIISQFLFLWYFCGLFFFFLLT